MASVLLKRVLLQADSRSASPETSPGSSPTKTPSSPFRSHLSPSRFSCSSRSSGSPGSSPTHTVLQVSAPTHHLLTDQVSWSTIKIVQTKPKYVTPVDYEQVIVKNRTVLHNDPQREMLLFPYDDVLETTIPRRHRTTRSSVPQSAVREAQTLMVKECIKSYTSSWNVIHYKYSAYSGNYLQLPSKCNIGNSSSLPEQVFEIDADAEGREEENAFKARNQMIAKKGWLFKGPDSGHESSIMSFTRSFKRRYFYLKQQADKTYILEFHKDDKKLEPKGSIFLDSAIEVIKNPKRGKNTFQIQMQDKNIYLLATETEADLDDWVNTLCKVIQNNDTGRKVIEKAKDKEPAPMSRINFQESLEHSMNPELQKYARETDSTLAQQRKDSRQKLFSLYPELKKCKPPDRGDDSPEVAMYREQFGKRFLVKCEGFTTRLQANLNEEGAVEDLSNPEPFFISLCLYDARAKEKISEDFHYDPNSEVIRGMIPKDILYALDMLNDNTNTIGNKSLEPDLNGIDPKWIAYPNIAVFSVVDPHPDIYLVARIEKVLQGSVSTCTEPYVRNPDIRIGSKIHRTMKSYCHRLGRYRMPFAWAVKNVFKPFSGELDMHADFVLYRADSTRMTEEELLKQLVDLKRPEKQSRVQSVHGKLTINLIPFKACPNTVTSSLLPVNPFPDPPTDDPAIEVEEFPPDDGKLASPYTTYTNHLYVYPRCLKYDSQKAFPKARNIAVTVEIRDSDDDAVVPLKLIRGRPGGPIFTSSANAAVLHHNTTPTFMEEVKILLPTQLHEKHHLLFKFYHIGCDNAKTQTSKTTVKKVHGTESPVGYAWFPLLINGRVNVGEQQVKVAVTLTPGYLGLDNVGGGRTSVLGTDIRWVDSTKPLFTFSLRLASTIYTKDQHLHSFFVHCQRLSESVTAETDVESVKKLQQPADQSGHCKRRAPDPTFAILQGLLSVDVSTVIKFLPTLFNQLFHLLVKTNNEEVASNTLRVLTRMVSAIHKAKSHDRDAGDEDKPDILQTYVKFVFVTEPVASTRDKTVHEQLATHLSTFSAPHSAESADIEATLNHLWFFFEIISKSMAQHLLRTGRIKMPRDERFPQSFLETIQNLLTNITGLILQTYRERPHEMKNANISLAHFIKRCFTFMDRGYVFRLITSYIEMYSPGDPKILQNFKFDFLSVICSHEHYIPLNLPLMRKQVKNYKEIRPEDLKHDYTLSEEFRKNHFLVGLLLHELKLALNEIRDIRKYAIRTLRDLLAKHSFDDRYRNKAQQARIANLYLPFIMIILENKNRLLKSDSVNRTMSQPNGDVSHQHDSLQRPQLISYNSSVSLDTTASAATTLSNQANSMPRNIRDPTVFALISGQAATSTGNLTLNSLEGRPSHHGSTTSLASSASSVQSNTTEKLDKESAMVKSHSRQGSIATTTINASTTGSQFVVRYDKLDSNEVKDLLLCFLYIVKNLSEDVLLGWFNNSSEYDILDFFEILETCMQHFKYLGKKRITSLCIIGDTRAASLPNKKSSLHNYNKSNTIHPGEIKTSLTHAASQSEADAMLQAMMEANLSSEVAIGVLDIITLYTVHFKDQLHFHDGANPVMLKIFDLYMSFLQISQSETVQKHAFGALRSFINKFPKVLFVGDASMCGRLCYEILRCCNSRLKSTRSEACALMYLLMRSNFEFCHRKSFTRVHLQVIVAVSELINDIGGLSNSRAFADSLSIINSYAHNDKAMQRLVFPSEVNDLTKRVRTVLMATAQMKEHQNDPEMLVDLQYCLAKSYTSTPELRKTWLLSMAKKHRENKDYSEAAHCYVHIASLVAEYLKRRGEFPQGCSAFRKISPNVETEEAGMKDDDGMQDFDYTEEKLTSLLEECANLFEMAERYEVLGDIYRLIIPIYERKRDFESLARAYQILYKSYNRVVEVMRSGKRLLGTYFRVAFFGQVYFEEEDGKEYVYKEPKVTSLTEICDRLKKLFSAKYGAENVKLIMTSSKVNVQDLDPKFAYIQVTHVTPYFDRHELEDRVTDFERNNNIRRFMFETPFTKSGKAHGEVEHQWKRRTVLTTSHAFPYIKKRIQVVYHNEYNISPIEVAIDEMTSKVSELREVINLESPDFKKLQLKLAGSVSAQVNAGPLAYAETFLEESNIQRYDSVKTNKLKDIFREFVEVCDKALKLNKQLISSDQLEYHESLLHYYHEMTERLSEIFGEQLTLEEDRISLASHRSSMTVFSVISSSGQSSQV